MRSIVKLHCFSSVQIKRTEKILQISESNNYLNSTLFFFKFTANKNDFKQKFTETTSKQLTISITMDLSIVDDSNELWSVRPKSLNL